MTSSHRFIILGTGGNFTYHVIKTLVQNNKKPLAYIQSGKAPQSKITFKNIAQEIVKPQNPFSNLLEIQNIPVLYQSQIKLVNLIQDKKVEYLLVACWPHLIPDYIVRSVSRAALNLHPSLLPRFRGIDPVGDQLSQKDYNFGISLHLIGETYDSGDIVLQQSLGQGLINQRDVIEKIAAEKGAELFMQAMNSFDNPGWQPIQQNQVSTSI